LVEAHLSIPFGLYVEQCSKKGQETPLGASVWYDVRKSLEHQTRP